MLFAEIVGDLTRPLLSLQSTVAYAMPPVSLERRLSSPRVFLFLRHPYPSPMA